ncbi:MAG: response regulator [Lachnospiraceae bacterium]|nr:response regulator [Lachnospiraceae bacterium]
MITQLDHLQNEKCCSEQDDGDRPAPADLEKYLQERIVSEQLSVKEFHFTGRKILVAEDMAINREIAEEILKQTGAFTEFAEDGEICLKKIEAKPAGYYDLILMDIMMPNMDGMEAARRIRMLPDRAKAGIPIIAMTSNVSEKERNAALDAGMNAFTEKPIFVDRLFETIKEYLPKE